MGVEPDNDENGLEPTEEVIKEFFRDEEGKDKED